MMIQKRVLIGVICDSAADFTGRGPAVLLSSVSMLARELRERVSGLGRLAAQSDGVDPSRLALPAVVEEGGKSAHGTSQGAPRVR